MILLDYKTITYYINCFDITFEKIDENNSIDKSDIF